MQKQYSVPTRDYICNVETVEPFTKLQKVKGLQSYKSAMKSSTIIAS